MDLLEDVNVVQQLGTIRNVFGDVLVKIITEQAGVLIMQRRIHRVYPGDSLIQVTQRLE